MTGFLVVSLLTFAGCTAGKRGSGAVPNRLSSAAIRVDRTTTITPVPTHRDVLARLLPASIVSAASSGR